MKEVSSSLLLYKQYMRVKKRFDLEYTIGFKITSVYKKYFKLGSGRKTSYAKKCDINDRGIYL